ncbi:SDR family oxidoreductase [Spongiibacter taiwanensis]|uniref:SDR family oxidoreductase n=1 Tax=Spongiibacter taiwanensis TaxID=1748242 RepID=UPI0020360A7D|nr:SDR family oxidoreductase [Spongiibacter taiwanensis]USA42436.1 SDR family oxidoreductase [Spongiibacter taiwanensis]
MANAFLDGLYSLDGKVALVTGGHKGIGKMIAEALTQAGARVYIASRSAGESDHPLAIPCDLASEAGIDALVAELQKKEKQLHILVNNAGYFSAAPVEDMEAGEWDTVLALNTKTPFFLVQKLLPMLLSAGSADDPARVINIGSIAGIMGGSNMAYAYGASKAALHQLTRTLASDLSARHITVNAIAPGFFPSEMTDGFFSAQEGLKDAIVAGTPRGRLGTAEDMGGMCIALCGRAGAFVCGQIIALDGGVLLK